MRNLGLGTFTLPRELSLIALTTKRGRRRLRPRLMTTIKVRRRKLSSKQSQRCPRQKEGLGKPQMWLLEVQ
ncbi:hypothetical protein SLEP1_g25583 [Rubroshorea leprosula]|uniref:Uncharacterized protein n=1 Tax=Rubroshorea leprosula TaxID=152421 RepID=A0AAV5JQQ0_9ROSI|nr:hypothetical protein SLEP1_g25583 [Rubroshorea leprosula]